MRSTAYSVMMTLLLLVPISAVPLMAIFGVPQFTPIVSSPLDEPDEDDWDRPARKKTRSISQVDQEDEIPDDETLEWSDAPEQRPRSLTKRRARANALAAGDDAEQSFAEAGDVEDPPPRKTGTLPRDRPDESSEDESPVQQAANEAMDGEASLVESAVHVDSREPAARTDAEDAAKIPGYRRRKSGSRQETDRDLGKPASKKKSSSQPADSLSWQKLSQRLSDYGIRNFRLESGEEPGEFTFICTYTPSNSPHVTRKFEAVADDPLKAVAKVLAQVEEASQQRVLASPRRMTESKTLREAEYAK